MRHWVTTALAISVMAGCGTDAGDGRAAGERITEGQATTRGRDAALREALDRVLASDAGGRSPVDCDVLRSGVLLDVFGSAADAAVLEPAASYMPQAMCTAAWDKPNREELELARADYDSRQVSAMIQRREFDEPPPPGPGFEVTLTIINRRYDSAEAAVTSLEGTVTSLTVAGTVYTRDREDSPPLVFEGFIDGVGDRAGWAPRLNELSAAYAGVRYAVAVRGFADEAENKEMAIELARRLAGG